jgi:type IV secretory pathway TrbL component
MRATLKVTFVLCAVAALTALAAAQGDDDKGRAPGVEVVGFAWKYDGYAPVEVVQSGKSGVTLSVKRGTSYVFKYTARVTLKNTAAKAVRVVEWEHVFFDPDGGKELKHYRLQSKQQVAAGATRALSKEVLIGPDENTRHLTSGAQKVRLTRVEFADGTVWRAEEERKL